MLFKRRKRPAAEERGEELIPHEIDPSLYGRLVDGELPLGWLEFHREFLQYNDGLINELAHESECAADMESALALHSQYVSSCEAFRDECAQRGECFVKYFNDTHGAELRKHLDWMEEHK